MIPYNPVTMLSAPVLRALDRPLHRVPGQLLTAGLGLLLPGPVPGPARGQDARLALPGRHVELLRWLSGCILRQLPAADDIVPMSRSRVAKLLPEAG